MVLSPHYRNSTPPGGCDFNNEEQAKLDKYIKKTEGQLVIDAHHYGII